MKTMYLSYFTANLSQCARSKDFYMCTALTLLVRTSSILRAIPRARRFQEYSINLVAG